MATVAANFPWLIPQETPGQALSRGVAVGSRVGETMMRGRIASDEMRYRSDQMRLAQQQQELNRIVVGQEMQMKALEVSEVLRKRDEEILSHKALGELSNFAARVFQSGDGGHDSAKAGALRILQRYPAAARNPAVQDLLDQFDAAKKMKVDQENLEKKEDFQLRMESMQQGAATERARIIAQGRLDVQDLRNRFPRRDSASGRDLTEKQYVDRHLNSMMTTHGYEAIEATEKLKEAYALISETPSPSLSPPVPDGSAPADETRTIIMEAFKQWQFNRGKE